jgi:hypothetical protein
MLLFISVLLVLVLLLVSPLIVGMVLLARKHARAGRIILGVYTMLIALFLIHAQFEKRSTSGHIFRWLKGEDGSHQRMNDLAEDAKKTVASAELQRWAMTVMQETQPTNTPPEIMADKVPAGIQSLVSGGVRQSYAHCDPSSDSVWIEWGGPMGHWGIRVGSPAFTVNSKSGDFCDYIKWKPGIYFWCETR